MQRSCRREVQVGLFSVSPFSLDGQRTPAMLFRQPSKSIHPIAAAKRPLETVAGGGPHIGLRLCQRRRINTGPTSSISAAGPNASTSIDDLRSLALGLQICGLPPFRLSFSMGEREREGEGEAAPFARSANRDLNWR
jgi:hypothetical protein